LQKKFVLLLQQAHFVGVVLFVKGTLDKQNRQCILKLYRNYTQAPIQKELQQSYDKFSDT
jgi:hypothetical protein